MPLTALYRGDNMVYGTVMNLARKKDTFSMIAREEAKTNPIRNGKWKEFNKHGVLIAEGFYLSSRKHGIWREYYDETGGIMIEEHYRDGIQEGRFASYHPNGQVFSEGQFCNGLREGYFKVYDEQGNNIRNLFFVNDIQVEDNEIVHTEERAHQKTAGS
jgi:antitoxin component YwqK of YwqJK toxin-antitoxin module